MCEEQDYRLYVDLVGAQKCNSLAQTANNRGIGIALDTNTGILVEE